MGTLLEGGALHGQCVGNRSLLSNVRPEISLRLLVDVNFFLPPLFRGINTSSRVAAAFMSYIGFAEDQRLQPSEALPRRSSEPSARRGLLTVDKKLIPIVGASEYHLQRSPVHK